MFLLSMYYRVNGLPPYMQTTPGTISKSDCRTYAIVRRKILQVSQVHAKHKNVCLKIMFGEYRSNAI